VACWEGAAKVSIYNNGATNGTLMRRRLKITGCCVLATIGVFLLILSGLGLRSGAGMNPGTTSLISLSSRQPWSLDDNMIEPEEMLSHVLQDQSPAGDEAAVILLDYHFVEHNAEELTTNLTQRGKRALPYLVKYRDRPAFPIRPDFWLLKIDQQTRDRTYNDVIGLIGEGKVLTQ
jgi:hypothetical protein